MKRLANIILTAERTLHPRSSHSDIELTHLRNLIGQLEPGDVNLAQACHQLERKPGHPLLGYMSIYKSANISISVFIMRTKRALIPLHDHPSMKGIVRALKGEILIKPYTKFTDLKRETFAASGRLQSDKINDSFSIPAYAEDHIVINAITPDTALLTPTDGNYHEIINNSDHISAFFDVLAPPYQESSDCNYYEIEVPLIPRRHNERNLVWLQPRREPPSDFWTAEIHYEPSFQE